MVSPGPLLHGWVHIALTLYEWHIQPYSRIGKCNRLCGTCTGKDVVIGWMLWLLSVKFSLTCRLSTFACVFTMSRQPCTAGSYCSSTGLAAPTGLCAPGFWCPTGSTTGSANLCPVGSSCPLGTAVPVPCGPGAYGPSAGLASCLACPSRNYCDGSSPTAPHICPMGSFCPLNSATPQLCA